MSDMDATPQRPESVSTVLARIEGVVRLVDFKVDGMGARMSTVEDRLTKHDSEFESVRLTMQRLGDEAKARADAEAAAAAAVKSVRAQDREDDDRHWAPKARLTVGLSLAATIALAIFSALAYYQH